MKRIQKVASLLLAMVMVFAMTVTAFASGGDVPENPPAGETGRYKIYQIFTGTFADGELSSNVKWGQNGTGTEGEPVSQDILDELAAVSAPGNTDAQKLAVIEKYCDQTGTPIAQGNSTEYPNLASGYYLIVDEGTGAEGEETSTAIARVTDGTLKFVPKVNSEPVPDKKVQDKDDSVSANSADESWQKAADYDIGDEIPFLLTATLPATVANYDTYYLAFVDTLSVGLDYVENSAVVKVGETVLTEGYTLTYEEHVLKIEFTDVKAAPVSATAGSVITVEYKAKLNENASFGENGNVNEFRLDYTNGDGTTGSTPPVTAVVFTFKTVVNKVKDDETTESKTSPLEGAEFTLNKLENGEWKQVKEFKNADGTLTSFSFDGLDAGRYQLVESKVPDGYNSIDPIYFTIEATHTADEAGKITLTLDVYETDENGVKLTENKTAEFTTTLTDGTATTDIVNKQGALLPSTGGIGTTIFYVVGGILVVVAGVLLVTRRRMFR